MRGNASCFTDSLRNLDVESVVGLGGAAWPLDVFSWDLGAASWSFCEGIALWVGRPCVLMTGLLDLGPLYRDRLLPIAPLRSGGIAASVEAIFVVFLFSAFRNVYVAFAYVSRDTLRFPSVETAYVKAYAKS